MIENGQKVIDRVSGFKGMVVGEYEYLHGCRRICIQPKVDENGLLPESKMFDEPQLEVLKDAPDGLAIDGNLPAVKLGDRVKCGVSGVKGIAVANCKYLNGCYSIGLLPKADKKNNVPPTVWVDEPQLEILKSKVVKEGEKYTGGMAQYKDPRM